MLETIRLVIFKNKSAVNIPNGKDKKARRLGAGWLIPKNAIEIGIKDQSNKDKWPRTKILFSLRASKYLGIENNKTTPTTASITFCTRARCIRFLLDQASNEKETGKSKRKKTPEAIYITTKKMTIESTNAFKLILLE